MEIRLLHLYYDIMNLYGEYGNVKVLEKHLEDQGFKVIVDKKTINDEKVFDQYDFIYMGSGAEKNQEVILEDIKKDKETLLKFIEDGKTVLFTGNSYEIFGKSINNNPALNILDFEVENIKNRITTDVICTSSILQNKVVGFVNNMSNIKNNSNTLFNVEWGEGNSIQNKQEGIKYKNLFGTHLIGPLLIRNPEILKLIVETICTSKDEGFSYKDIEYMDEQKGYELVLSELESRQELVNK